MDASDSRIKCTHKCIPKWQKCSLNTEKKQAHNAEWKSLIETFIDS